MASALFEEMQDKLQEFSKAFVSLSREFRRTGDDELFCDLCNNIIRLKDCAYTLPDKEEQFEIISDADALLKKLDSSIHSA